MSDTDFEEALQNARRAVTGCELGSWIAIDRAIGEMEAAHAELEADRDTLREAALYIAESAFCRIKPRPGPIPEIAGWIELTPEEVLQEALAATAEPCDKQTDTGDIDNDECERSEQDAGE